MFLLKFERGFFMTLREKLNYLEENHPEVYKVLEEVVPELVKNPENPSYNDVDHYNFWIDSIDEDEAQPLYHFLK